MDITHSAVLAVIADCRKQSELAQDKDDQLLLRLGIMPRLLLRKLFQVNDQNRKWFKRVVNELVEDGRILQSKHYVAASPFYRQTIRASSYNVMKPAVVPHHRNNASHKMWGRDRLAAWYAAANHDFSISKGEAKGLELILEFWRRPSIQRAWAKHVGRPGFKLPDDAKKGYRA